MGGWSECIQCKKGGRGGWTNEASREMGDASLLLLLLEGDFSIFNLASLPSCSLFLSVSLFLYPSLTFVLLVLCGAFLLLSLFLSSLPLTASPLFFSLSSCINYLSYEFPYLPDIAPVDLLSLIPSLARIGSYGSNRVPLSPAAVKI